MEPLCVLDNLIRETVARARRPRAKPHLRVEATAQPADGSPNDRPAAARGGSVDRRLAVRACRVLRIQIKAFEDGFSEKTRRRPRGSDRRPLASTYRQYRDWKRCIRHDAAAAIQQLLRRRRGLPLAPAAPRAAAPNCVVAQLRLDKRSLKKKLRAYDAQFLAKHGRAPTRFEKEPIRGLYEAYYGAKERLRTLSSGEDNSS